MPALVDTMAWLRAEGAPWHGLGYVMETVPKSGREAMKMAGLDWEVICLQLAALVPDTMPSKGKILGSIKVPIEEVEDSGEEEQLVRVVSSKNNLVVRKDTGAQLGIVGSGYQPMQNVDAFDWFDSALGVGKAQYVTAGSLKGGRIVWALVRLPGWMRVGGGDDLVGKYMLLTTSHDGSMAVWIMITPIRVVCWNTLQAAFMDSRIMAKFWHTKGLQGRMFDYAEQLAKISEVYEKTEKAFDALANHQVTSEQVETYIETLFPIPEDAKRPQRMEGNRKAVLDRFEGQGMGADLDSAKGTAWGLYNATSEWADHARGRDGSRLYQSWYGDGAKLKADALNLSLGMLS